MTDAKKTESKKKDPFQAEFEALPLVTDTIQLFPLNWTLVHAITEESLLWGKTAEDLEKLDIEIIITVSGFDDTFAQTVHARNSYKWHEIGYGQKFLPMYYIRPDGMTMLELDKISAVMPVELSQA